MIDGVERAFAEHRLGRMLVEVAAGAVARVLEQRLPRRAQVAARLDRALGFERVLQSPRGNVTDHSIATLGPATFSFSSRLMCSVGGLWIER